MEKGNNYEKGNLSYIHREFRDRISFRFGGDGAKKIGEGLFNKKYLK
jgi:hypothetical protein